MKIEINFHLRNNTLQNSDSGRSKAILQIQMFGKKYFISTTLEKPIQEIIYWFELIYRLLCCKCHVKAEIK